MIRVAMLTSTGPNCGIAAYTHSLIDALDTLVDITVEPIEVGKQPTAHYKAQADRLNEADVIHIQHEHAFWGGILPGHSAFWELRYLLRKPVVLTAHTTTRLRQLLRTDQEKRPLHRIAKEMLLLRKGYRDSVETAPFVTARTIVHTEEAKRELVARGGDETAIQVIRAGVPQVIPSVSGGNEFRAKHGLSDRPIVSLFGFIAPNKGYEVMLEALRDLPLTTVFIIAGGSRNQEMEPYALELRQRVKGLGLSERVVETGFLDDASLAEAMSASTLVIAPHIQATGSYSVMLPIAFGRAIVASDLACFHELQSDGAGIELTPPRDSRALSCVLNRLLTSPEERVRLEDRSADYASRHTWGDVAKRTVQVYLTAIEEAKLRRGGA